MNANRYDFPAIYQIQVKGVLGQNWEVWFEGMHMSVAGDLTTITGQVPDQPALFGLLSKVRDLGLCLMSVQILEDEGDTHEP